MFVKVQKLSNCIQTNRQKFPTPLLSSASSPTMVAFTRLLSSISLAIVVSGMLNEPHALLLRY